MRVLAVDPGGTTGWATWEDGEVRWGQIPGGLFGAVEALIRPDWTVGFAERVDVCVIEKYTIGARTVKYSRQSDALEITGVLKALSAAGRTEWLYQQPAEAKRLFTDERLREFGWWAKGEEHARDALRHLGFYLARKRLIRLTGDHSGQ